MDRWQGTFLHRTVSLFPVEYQQQPKVAKAQEADLQGCLDKEGQLAGGAGDGGGEAVKSDGDGEEQGGF